MGIAWYRDTDSQRVSFQNAIFQVASREKEASSADLGWSSVTDWSHIRTLKHHKIGLTLEALSSHQVRSGGKTLASAWTRSPVARGSVSCESPSPHRTELLPLSKNTHTDTLNIQNLPVYPHPFIQAVFLHQELHQVGRTRTRRTLGSQADTHSSKTRTKRLRSVKEALGDAP